MYSDNENALWEGVRYPGYEGEHTFRFGGGNDRFFLESGASLPSVTVNYQTYGNLNSAGDNAIFIAHALTGGSLVGDLEVQGKERGWWEPLIGPGKAFDTDRYFVVCSNVLGGATGPRGLLPWTSGGEALTLPGSRWLPSGIWSGSKSG